MKAKKNVASNSFDKNKNRSQPKDIDAERHPEEQMYKSINSNEPEIVTQSSEL